MSKVEFIKLVNKKFRFKRKIRSIIISQINNYYIGMSDFNLNDNQYNIGDEVKLLKGTMLHGTYKNIDGLREIVNNGLISSWFNSGRYSKYPGCVGVWNLKKDYMLKDYIDFYSGGTVNYYNHNNDESETEVIPLSEFSSFIDKFRSKDYLVWKMEQTKEARFLPSLVQDKVQIGIIINGNNKYIKDLLKGDLLDSNNVSDVEAKSFVNKYYYRNFIKDRINKNDFFTDRESAIIFGIPANFIEGILVGRIYENDRKILTEIKSLLPNCYICNLDGVVIL